MSSKGKRRRTPPREPETDLRRPRTAAARRARNRQPERGRGTWLWLGAGVVVLLAGGLALAYLLGFFAASPAQATGCSLPAEGRPPGPPDVEPLVDPPAEPRSDGTRATIETELGNIVIELYCDSSPVAAQNFVNLAAAGYYDGVVFHRIVPGFVIQGGDPQGDGRGGPGYGIADEEVIGEYQRGTVAMARTPAPNSQGSQFFVVLDDGVRQTLPKSGMYAIFGRVVEGMDVVDEIAAGPAENQQALEPVSMTRVTVQAP